MIRGTIGLLLLGLITILATLSSLINVTFAIPLLPGTQNNENISSANFTRNNAMHIQLCSSQYPCAKK